MESVGFAASMLVVVWFLVPIAVILIDIVCEWRSLRRGARHQKELD